MLAQQLITEYIPAISPTCSVQKAIEIMEENKVSHLPVVKNNHFRGMVSEDQLLEVMNPFDVIDSLIYTNKNGIVLSYQHLLEAIKILSEQQLSLIAVLNSEQEYMGVISARDLLFELGKRTSIQNPGAIIEVLVSQKDYSLADLTRIIESNGGKVMHVTINIPDENSGNMLVTLKLSDTEISKIIAALERFQYVITSKFVNLQAQDDTFRNLDNLFKFLDI